MLLFAMMVLIKFAHGRAQNEKGRESKEDAELDEKERGGGWLDYAVNC